MSLLHKALKKAERGEDLMRDGTFVDSEETLSKPGASPWKVVGLSVLIACLLLLGAVRLLQLKKGGMSSAPRPKDFNTPLEIAGGPGAGQLGDEALSLIGLGKYEEARQRLEKVVILEPRNAEAYNNLGFVLKKLGKKEEAYEQYRKAVSINPSCAQCRNNLGALYMADKNLSDAESEFRKAIEIKSDYADPYFHLAMILESRNEPAGAKANYQKFLEHASGVDGEFLVKVQKRIAELKVP